MTERKRAIIYRALVALGGLSIIYGLASEAEVSHWLELAGAVLMWGGLDLASLNTSTKKPVPHVDHPHNE